MADGVDATSDRMESELALTLQGLHMKAAAIPAGQPGECFLCGEYFARVVFVASIGEHCCGGCRDRRGLE